jgi:hypothetical protein
MTISEVLGKIAARLEQRGIAYMLAGSFASALVLFMALCGPPVM